jgi:hypothetical protein
MTPCQLVKNYYFRGVCHLHSRVHVIQEEKPSLEKWVYQWECQCAVGERPQVDNAGKFKGN